MRLQIGKLAAVAAGLWLSATGLAFDHSHDAWTKLLGQYQDDKGLMHYKELKDAVAKDKAHPFPTYLKSLEAVKKAEFKSWSKPQQMAFLINAYNAFTVKLIVDKYPVKSIKDTGSLFTKPWSVEFFSLLEGDIKALDPIEHEYLRPKYKDYRVHAAVNCASISCPPLRHEAFVADRLDAQLDEQMREWLQDPSRNQYDASTGALHVSKIFDWYEKDFVAWGGGVAKVIEKYGPPPALEALKKKGTIDHLDYDWGLNESRKTLAVH